MYEYINILENNLSAADRGFLKEIREPVVVCVPPVNTRNGISILPDGEIRYYASSSTEEDPLYLSSRDCGLSWKKAIAKKGSLGAASAFGGGRYGAIRNRDGKTYCVYSDIGSDDTGYKTVFISDEEYFDMFLPTELPSGRIITSAQWNRELTENGIFMFDYCPVVMFSDDRGDSWQVRKLHSAPRFHQEWPHKGLRWENNGNECSLCMLPDGRLMLLARTSQDYYWVYYSNDCGDTWTDGEQSSFHATLTTPFLLRLSDGRAVCFWNNTQPLPELDHTAQGKFVGYDLINGLWEDVFTNRDACHAAISEDGKTWRGFRETGLSEIRNYADYRTVGDRKNGSGDKSVQQFQAYELPYNKILLSYGQHSASRRVVIFDIDWLYENSRTEDFRDGLTGISTHTYVKSLSASIINITHGEHGGHCAWNRTNGPLLVPDPDETGGEALNFTRIRDPRLFSETQGAAWNFPALEKGRITAQVRISGSGLRFSLTDRFINPIDTTIDYWAALTFDLEKTAPKDRWFTLEIIFNLSKDAEIKLDGEPLRRVPFQKEAPNGLCYLHIQSLAVNEDFKGSYIRRLEAREEL